ncbi:hypothetical protein JH39_13745 [Listeria monocytogenes]|nr:hypothetical protein [Listeria monocytogenes]EAC8464733.1 hypothetical protein [Listeria monocytogenes]
MDGWIKLHRSILESDTYNFLSLHQKLIMIEILLRANFSDGFWLDKKIGKKVELKAGQLITSINKIKVEWLKNEKQISDKKIRNTLEKLQKLGFLSIKTTSNYTMLTVCNYSDYQREDLEKGEQKDKQGANKGQSEGNAKASKGQQCKKEKKEKKKKNNKNNNKRQNKFDDAHLSLAKLLFELIKKNNPEEKDHDMEKWAHDIRVMIEQDKRDIEKVKNTIIWSQNNDFWCGVIKSPKSLRKNYDQMATRRNKPVANKPFNKYNKQTKQEVLPDWFDKDQQEAPKKKKMTEEEKKAYEEVMRKLGRGDELEAKA